MSALTPVDLGVLSEARACELERLVDEEIKRTTWRVIREQTADYIKAPVIERPIEIFGSTWHLVQRPAPHAETLAKLKAISFDMREIRLTVGNGWFGQELQAHAEVKPLRVETTLTTCTLNGISHTLEGLSSAELVKRARDALIGLITHEIDEVLFVAGLGPDPHAGDL
jgi:hypothetical protein